MAGIIARQSGWDPIVKQIQSGKNNRQLILANHNPNIVVKGDSELVQILQFMKGQVQMHFQGEHEEEKIWVRICTIMEGGKKAFEKRSNKIMQKSYRV